MAKVCSPYIRWCVQLERSHSHPSFFVSPGVSDREKPQGTPSFFISFPSVFCKASNPWAALRSITSAVLSIPSIRNPSFYQGLLTSLDPLSRLPNHSLPNAVYLPTRTPASVALCFPATQTGFYLICPYNRHEWTPGCSGDRAKKATQEGGAVSKQKQ